MNSEEREAVRRAEFARLRLIHEELDRLDLDAGQRSSSVLSKASFLSVATGVIIAAATARLWDGQPVLGAIALALACFSLVCASIALRPGNRLGILPQRLVDRYLDTTKAAITVEREIVLDKSKVLGFRENDITLRAKWVLVGFVLLIASTAALCITFAIETLGGT